MIYSRIDNLALIKPDSYAGISQLSFKRLAVFGLIVWSALNEASIKLCGSASSG
jgi:hypothetical protein